jgi:energy-coupling factor transporter transmembrane protein EcfT
MQAFDDHYSRKSGTGETETWKPHPAMFILSWVLLAIVMQSLHAKELLLLGALLMAVALKLSAGRLHVLLRRTRWIMLSLMLVYGYVTPGEALWTQAGMLSPTQQGLLDGLLQLSRLVFMLAALSVVLNTLSRQQLIGGLYTLMFPLRWFGLSRERVAVRLALTLHYAETSMKEATVDWRGSIENALAPGADGNQAIELFAFPFTWRDVLLLAACAALLVLVML